MRSRIVVAGLLALTVPLACTNRAPAEEAVDDAPITYSSADFASDNLELVLCTTPPIVDLSKARAHEVRPNATLHLPTPFAAMTEPAELQRWSNGHASVEVRHTSEPAEGLATSGPAVPIGDVSQCALRVSGAFAKLYTLALHAPGEADTTFLALLYAYPRSGLAFNITIEAQRREQRDSLIAFASQLSLRNES